MNESTFWSQKIRPLLAPHGMVTRIENGLDAGVPDVFYCITGVRGWVELKYRDATPRQGTIVFPSARRPDGRDCKGLRKGQIAWWTDYLVRGGHGGVVYGIGDEMWLFPPTLINVQLFNGAVYSELTAMSVRLSTKGAELVSFLCSR